MLKLALLYKALLCSHQSKPQKQGLFRLYLHKHKKYAIMVISKLNKTKTYKG